tara:strand:- start:766 stop:1242 length:477 start_codon:yes stop_codon:yes gene_type:complete
MKRKELISLIENMVRKEVKKQINTIFISEGIRSIKANSKLDFKEKNGELLTKPEVEKKKSVRYTSNETLNNILNETKGGLPTDGKEEYPTLGGETFDTNRMTELLGYGKSDEGKRNVGAVETIKNAGVSVEDVPDHVTNALTRDYRDLMKAIDKKKRN